MDHILTALYIAEVSYVFVGIDLIRRARETRGLPGLFLGLAFVFNGLSYLFTDLPITIENEAIVIAFSYIGRIFAAFCSLTIAVFTWRVFRPKAAWAKWACSAAGALLVLGLTVSALEGDWEGVYPLTYKGFWFEWLGGFAPFIWFAVESLRAYSRSRRKLRIGLADPIVTNRFLLIGFYGTLASITYPVYLWMYVIYERHGTWSDPLSVFSGTVEVISLVALWTSFAAPAFYRRWVTKVPTDA
jgi:Kef-type K+ transport system membrane component KefB